MISPKWAVYLVCVGQFGQCKILKEQHAESRRKGGESRDVEPKPEVFGIREIWKKGMFLRWLLWLPKCLWVMYVNIYFQICPTTGTR